MQLHSINESYKGPGIEGWCITMQVPSTCINENYKGPGIDDIVLQCRFAGLMKTTRALELKGGVLQCRFTVLMKTTRALELKGGVLQCRFLVLMKTTRALELIVVYLLPLTTKIINDNILKRMIKIGQILRNLW
jgi:hypothetical protein